MIEAPDTERSRQEVILDAAMSMMCQYGYRRTSMEDIAQAAGMSRPALYQHFRNKEDIGRRMVEVYFDQAAQGVTRALAEEGSVADRLARAFTAKTGQLIGKMLESPHGAELLDIKESQATAEVAQGRARLIAIFADWLRREGAAGRVVLDGTPEDVATMLLGALDGIKRPPYDRFRADRDRLAKVLGRGLEAG